jgi:phage-related protein
MSLTDPIDHLINQSVKLFTVAVHPNEAQLISEEGSMESCVEFGGGYRQISYNGLLRRWRIVFGHRLDAELRDIQMFLRANASFLWVQPSPHDSDGQHRARVKRSSSYEVDGQMRQLEYIFEVEVLGHSFAQEASSKYGARDTGVARRDADEPMRPC